MKKKYAVCVSCAVVLILLCTAIVLSAHRKQSFFKDTTLITDNSDISDDLYKNVKSLKEATGIQLDLQIPLHRTLAKNYEQTQIIDEQSGQRSSVIIKSSVKIHTWEYAEENVLVNLICIDGISTQPDDCNFICQITDKTGKGLSNSNTYKIYSDGMLLDTDKPENQFVLYYYKQADIFLQKSAQVGGAFTAEAPPAKYAFADGNTKEAVNLIQLCGKLNCTDNPLTAPKLVSLRIQLGKKDSSFSAEWWIGKL